MAQRKRRFEQVDLTGEEEQVPVIKRTRPSRPQTQVLDLTLLSDEELASPRDRGGGLASNVPRRGGSPRCALARRQHAQTTALSSLASCKDDERLARRLQEEEQRRVAEADNRLRLRMDALEAQETAAEANGSGLFGSLGGLVGGRGRPRSSAAAAAGTTAASRACGETPALPPCARSTGPRSGQRRRSGRWGELSGGLGTGIGASLGAFGPFGGLFGGHGGFGGGHPHPFAASGHLAALQQVVGGSQSGLPPHMLLSDRDFTDADYELLLRLDEKVQSKRGAAPEKVAALRTETLHPGASTVADACTICMEQPRAGEQLCRLGCGHCYHAACIKRWLQQKNSCPVCQAAAV